MLNCGGKYQKDPSPAPSLKDILEMQIRSLYKVYYKQTTLNEQ